MIALLPALGAGAAIAPQPPLPHQAPSDRKLGPEKPASAMPAAAGVLDPVANRKETRMFIRPPDTGLDEAERQTWIAEGHDFGLLSVPTPRTHTGTEPLP